MNVPLQLTQIIGQVVLVRVGFATREIADVQPSQRKARGGNALAHHRHGRIGVHRAAFRRVAKQLDAFESAIGSQLQHLWQLQLGTRCRTKYQIHYRNPSQSAHISSGVSKRMSLLSLRENRPMSAMRIF